MGQLPQRTTVVICNPQGLHFRPATLFTQLAASFESNIRVIKGDIEADGKSILTLAMLAAEKGTELAIEADGPDAEQALAALADLVNRGFVENEEAS